jgi:hypothetical protein
MGTSLLRVVEEDFPEGWQQGVNNKHGVTEILSGD